MRPLFSPYYIVRFLKPAKWFEKNVDTIKNKLHRLNSGHPDVSVIIPAYNEEENILRTLASIAQSVTNFKTEVIVVDNNSTDNTKSLILRSGCRYIFEGKKGVKAARTRGLHYAKGKYIINADADTIYSPYWIEDLIMPLHNHDDIAMTYGKFAFITERNNSRIGFYVYETCGDIYKMINGILKDKAMYVYGCSSAYRKEQALMVDAYEHPPDANEDGYLALKLRNRFGRLVQISDKNSFAWTSGRQLVSDGTLTNRLIKKVMNLF